MEQEPKSRVVTLSVAAMAVVQREQEEASQRAGVKVSRGSIVSRLVEEAASARQLARIAGQEPTKRAAKAKKAGR